MTARVQLPHVPETALSVAGEDLQAAVVVLERHRVPADDVVKVIPLGPPERPAWLPLPDVTKPAVDSRGDRGAC